MKIMFCVLCLNYGGAEKNLCIVANELCKRGHDIYICNLNYLPTVQYIDNSVTVIDAPSFSTRGVKRFQQLNFIIKCCKDIHPDLLVSFLYIPNILTPIAGKILHIPTIISERGDPSKRNGKLQRFYSLATGAVFQTEGARKYFKGKLYNKGTVIPNPVILSEKYEKKYDYNIRTKSIIFSARFSIQQKRQDLMLDAFKIVHEKYPEYILNFFGDGPDEEKIKQYTTELGLEHSVRFNGLTTNMVEELIKSEIFVLSSDYEGIPNSLIEAMSIGLPCVSTDCTPGGARLLINNGENGLIVERGNSTLLAAAILRMIEDRAFAIKCGNEAKKISQTFSLENIMNDWERYCMRIVEEY